MTNQFPHIKNSPIHRRQSLTASAARTDLRYKSIATSSSDKVKVTNFNRKDSIIFKDKYGVRLKLSDNNILNFSSQSTANSMKYFVIIFLFVLPLLGFGQKNKTPEEILGILKLDDLNNYNKIDSLVYYDYSSCFYSKELKAIILQLADIDNYYRFISKKYKEKLSTEDVFIANCIKHGRSDSIFITKELKDSIINKMLFDYKKRFYEKPFLPKNVIYFISQFKWVEIYEIVYNLNLLDGKDYYKDALVKFQDPIACNDYMNNMSEMYKFRNQLKKDGYYQMAINEQSDILHYYCIEAIRFETYGSFGIQIYKTLLKCQDNLDIQGKSYGGEGPIIQCPCNVYLLSIDTELNRILYNYLSPNTKSIFNVIHSKELYDFSNNQLQNMAKDINNLFDDFEIGLEKLSLYLNQQELYWKQNMPYYKQEQDSLNNN